LQLRTASVMERQTQFCTATKTLIEVLKTSNVGAIASIA